MSYKDVLKDRGYYEEPILQGRFEKFNEVVEFFDNNVFGKKVLFMSDFDNDGTTSSILFGYFCRDMGLDIDIETGERHKGYGLNDQWTQEVLNRKYDTVITADFGITAKKNVDRLLDAGMNVLITDHHTPQEGLIPNCLVVNPKLEKNSDFYNLSGGGVIFKLTYDLLKHYKKEHKTFKSGLVVASMSTIGDMVDLDNYNWNLVREGLKHLYEKDLDRRLYHFIDKAVYSKTNTSDVISFGLAPVINSVGRLYSQNDITLKYFLGTGSSDLLYTLLEVNKERKTIQAEAEHEAEQLIDLNDDILIVKINAPKGIVGLVASHLTTKYLRPSIVFNQNHSASARSLGSISIFDIISSIKENDYMLGFGGHNLAAGLSIKPGTFEYFKEDILNSEALQINLEKGYEFDDVFEIEYGEIEDVIETLAKYEPFGQLNPLPTFRVSARVLDIEIKNGHSFISVEKADDGFSFSQDNTSKYTVLLFKTETKLDIGADIDIIGTITPSGSIVAQTILER